MDLNFTLRSNPNHRYILPHPSTQATLRALATICLSIGFDAAKIPVKVIPKTIVSRVRRCSLKVASLVNYWPRFGSLGFSGYGVGPTHNFTGKFAQLRLASKAEGGLLTSELLFESLSHHELNDYNCCFLVVSNPRPLPIANNVDPVHLGLQHRFLDDLFGVQQKLVQSWKWFVES